VRRVRWWVTVAAVVALAVPGAGQVPEVRVKDIARLSGVRANQLFGYGLVVGLAGTGDSSGAFFTVQSVANMLARLGVTVPASRLRVRNVAAVMVTAELGPFAREGDRLDVTLSSLGDARSLVGGVLLQTPLQAADGKVYAVAQGPVTVGGAGEQSGREQGADQPPHRGPHRRWGHGGADGAGSGGGSVRGESRVAAAGLLHRQPGGGGLEPGPGRVSRHRGGRGPGRRGWYPRTTPGGWWLSWPGWSRWRCGPTHRPGWVVNERTGTVVIGGGRPHPAGGDRPREPAHRGAVGTAGFPASPFLPGPDPGGAPDPGDRDPGTGGPGTPPRHQLRAGPGAGPERPGRHPAGPDRHPAGSEGRRGPAGGAGWCSDGAGRGEGRGQPRTGRSKTPARSCAFGARHRSSSPCCWRRCSSPCGAPRRAGPPGSPSPAGRCGGSFWTSSWPWRWRGREAWAWPPTWKLVSERPSDRWTGVPKKRRAVFGVVRGGGAAQAMTSPRVVNCPRCGRLSSVLVRGQCGHCLREEHEQLRTVQGLLAERGPLSAEEISRETGVPVERVLRWLREGRLVTSGDVVRCRRCGRPVRLGVLCSVCRVELAVAIRQVEEALRAQPAPQEARPRRRRVRREPAPQRFDLW
jgi:hypothetical protein